MDFIRGMAYNLRGLRLGLRTPKLLLLGLIRLGGVLAITVFAAGLILYYHQQIFDTIWPRPDNAWWLWLWHLTSWILSLLMIGLAAVVSYLAAQILFAVFIMDWMSRITERIATGQNRNEVQAPMWRQFGYMVKTEVPRTTLPVLLSLMLLVLGWLTPLGPILTVLSSVIAAVFLSWDNTDLIPARRMEPFGQRFNFLLRTLPFHLGFGLLLLVPIVNLLLLSYAPVGATLYYVEHHDNPGQTPLNQ